MCNGLVKIFFQLLNAYNGNIEKIKWVWIDLTSRKYECGIHIKGMDQSNLIYVFYALEKKVKDWKFYFF